MKKQNNNSRQLKRLSGQSGFTLIELMISMFILAIGLLAMANLQIAAINGNAFARNATEMDAVAQRTLEHFYSLPYASLSDGCSTDPANLPGGVLPDRVDEIKTCVTEKDGAVKVISVGVKWTERGKQKTTIFSVIKGAPLVT
ncbi:prepilin-type N-terminal cleavage/methylation domain-containing protein [Desulfobacterales bacterium HSG16]|nr:prepilin-type N-terminal cleavage/methylation domain-containing protein [Desulfobacterales bacterium HSG16]